MSEIVVAESQAVAVNLEKVVVGGDLTSLSSTERMGYYQAVCKSIGLNPLTRPFEYLKLNGKLVLYARKDATDQMRSIHGISIELVSRVEVGDCYVVTAKATNSYGRTDESTGVVPIGGLKGEALANALMKAETKAKRRVTLSICGLGFLDETEIETISANVAQLDHNRRVQDIRESLGVSKESVIAMLASFGATRPNDLSPDECDQLIAMIEAEAAAIAE